jgi:asparagine synthase (glutamine-hydrolysing)
MPKDLKKIIEGGKTLSKRGPDDSVSILKSNGIYMFHRLSINDTSKDGSQPMTSGNVLMMCNGEIYNHKELEQEYELKCTSKSDCEVILRLYEKIGFVDTVKKLHGVYAIVLVDGSDVYLARDPIGIRPLFFGITQDNFFAVASTPNALVRYCHSVQHFPPNSAAKVNPENNLEFLYINEFIPPFFRTENGIDQLRDALVEAVKIRLMSDRPLGCLLSGGLDSSIVASILAKFLGGKNVRTYSIGMTGSTDLFYARKVADFLGTEHHEVIFTPEEGLEVIPKVIETLATYDITTIRASVGMYLVSKYISETSQDKVIFSGEGSDELLEGYLYFHKAPSPKEAEDETLRLIKELHLYDVLRVDRCVSSWGLEPRVPFLDRNVIQTVLSLSKIDKFPYNGCEKYILRKAFEGWLPSEVLWRKKETFSDGVSSVQKSWFTYIQEFVGKIIPDSLFNTNFPSKEAMYYKMLFDNFFPTYKLNVPYWLPKWCGDVKDPSARVLKVYESSTSE